METQKSWILVIATLLVLGSIMLATGDPINPRLLYNNTETPGTLSSALMLNHTKGRITTLRLNATQPDEDWKGYVGNVTGKLTLDDAENYTLFDWTFSTVNGEVYATRGSTINWASVMCANSTHIAAEDSALNHLSTQQDRINNTFTNNTHPEFYIGDTDFSTNECNYTVYTYVNNSLQGKQFSEVLLYDSANSNLIYTAILNDSTLGFDTGLYDFQMIVSEDSSLSANIPYYFYVEVG